MDVTRRARQRLPMRPRSTSTYGGGDEGRCLAGRVGGILQHPAAGQGSDSGSGSVSMRAWAAGEARAAPTVCLYLRWRGGRLLARVRAGQLPTNRHGGRQRGLCRARPTPVPVSARAVPCRAVPCRAVPCTYRRRAVRGAGRGRCRGRLPVGMSVRPSKLASVSDGESQLNGEVLGPTGLGDGGGGGGGDCRGGVTHNHDHDLASDRPARRLISQRLPSDVA
jgi:hypothetical protein